MTCPTQEAGEAIRERPGVVYRPGDALQEDSHVNAVAIARRACISRLSARRPTDAGVSKATPPPSINKTLI